MSSENLRRNTLGEANRKLGGSVELQALAVAWGRGLVPDLHKERWTPEKRLNSKVGPPTGPSQMSLVLVDGQVLEMINDMASSLGGGITNLVGWLHTKATLGSFHMLGKDTVQITPHRTHACAHFFVACHFAQFVQWTCIGSRCLRDSLCVSPKSSHPRTMSLLGVPEFSAFSLVFTSSTTTLTGIRRNPCATRLWWTVWPSGRSDSKHRYMTNALKDLNTFVVAKVTTETDSTSAAPWR